MAKKKAKIAVARSMAVTMLALLQHPEKEYVPLYSASAAKAADCE